MIVWVFQCSLPVGARMFKSALEKRAASPERLHWARS